MNKERFRSISVSDDFYSRITRKAPREPNGHIRRGWMKHRIELAINAAIDAEEKYQARLKERSAGINQRARKYISEMSSAGRILRAVWGQ